MRSWNTVGGIWCGAVRKLFAAFPHRAAALSACLAVLAAAGCGDEAVARRRLHESAAALVEQYIRKELNRQIQENQGKGLDFYLPSERTLLIGGRLGTRFAMVPGAFPELQEFQLAGNYLAAEVSYRVERIEPGEVQNFSDGRFSCCATLVVQLTLRERLWKQVSGIPVFGAAIARSATGEELERRFRAECGDLLPNRTFDYAAIVRTQGEVTVRRVDLVLPVDYDPARPGWVLHNLAPELLDRVQAEPVRWPDPEHYFPRGGKVERYHGKLYWKPGAELLRKCERGMVYRDGEWRDGREFEQTGKLEKFFAAWRNRAPSLEQTELLLKMLKECPAARNREAVLNAAERAALELVQGMVKRGELEAVKAFRQRLRDDAVWKLLPPRVAAAAEEGERALTARRRDLWSARCEQLRQTIADLAGLKVREGGSVQAEIVTARAVALMKETGAAADIAEFQDWALRFRCAYVVRCGDLKEALRLSGRRKNGTIAQEWAKQLFQPCNVCQNGAIVCGSCTQGRCPDCRGAGRKNNAVCTLCGGAGLCGECGGRGRVPCPECEGRRVTAEQTGAEKMRTEALGKLTGLLHQTLAELERKKNW